jgi:DNA repair protein RAD50
MYPQFHIITANLSQLCDEKEVLAQVKLKFRNASGNVLNITRSISLTCKKASYTQKTLDCSLSMTRHGERMAMSTKVAELDKIVPEQLGVSPAILESVIFCHQDESLWPMSEPSKLKVKFDEIFEAQKYTKAIDVLVKLRKTHMEKLNVLKEREGNSRELKDKSERVQKKMIALEKDLDELREKGESLGRQMSEALERRNEMNRKKNDALRIVNELHAKRSQAEGLENTLTTLSSTLEELEDSDESLQTKLDQYEDRLQHFMEQENEFKAQYRELQEAVNASRQQLSRKQAEKGQCLAQKETYEKNIQNRIQLVNEAARSHSRRGYDGDLDEIQVQEFIEWMHKQSQEKDRELDRITKSTRDELKKTQAQISELENRQATRTEQKVNAKQTVTSNERKLKSRQMELDGLKIDEGAKAALDERYRNIQSSLQRANADWEAAGWDDKKKIESKRQNELQIESNRLKEELFQSNKLAEDRVRLEAAKKNAKTAKTALDTSVSNYKDQLDIAVGEGWEPKSLAQEFQAAIDRKTRAVDNANKAYGDAEKDLEKTIFKLDTARSNQKNKKIQMQKCEATVLDSITDPDGQPIKSVDSYLGEVQTLEKEREQLKKEIDGISMYTEYFKQCLETVKQDNCCRLCTRPFADDKEKTSATEKIKKSLAKYVKEELVRNLQEFDADLKTARDARPQYDIFKAIQEEIPILDEEIEKLEKEKASRDNKAEQLERLLSEAKSNKREVEALSETVNSITNYYRDLVKHEQEIASLSSQQKFSGSSMSMEEMREQMANCDEQIRVIQLKIEKIAADKETARTEIQKLELDEGNIKHKIASAESELREKQNILKAMEELRQNNAQMKEVMRSADEDLEALHPDLAKARAQHEDVQRRGQSKTKEVQVEKDKITETVNKLNLVDASINDYVESGGPGKLAASERAIKAFEKDQERIEKEISQVAKKSNDIKTQIADSGHTKSSILENIRYRNVSKQLQGVKREIVNLEREKANDDYDKYDSEATAADMLCQKILAQRGPIVGAIVSKDKEMADMIAEWETDYKNAAQHYRESHIQVETTKAVMEDLGKCKIALDHAIMKYHSIKMEEINAIAGELWRSTYQGTDIDTIMIRSEHESATAKRNYNYRLVMVKQDTEMDMRGRCSAGQRVLASIIIRLALAECFGVNCGVSLCLPESETSANNHKVIALDEPTTNLDRDNIKALAQSLNKIISSRKNQANFQLIIITHDEDFLREMKCTEFSETYFRVARDHTQCSTIEKQSLSDFM